MSKYKNINRHNTYPGIEYDLGLVNPETHIANFQNNDVFCAVMGNKDNEDFIVELLNSILSESITEPIKHIENIDTRGEKSSTYSGLTFYDFRCVTDSNKKIIVEMQCYNDEYLMERMLIYLAKTFISQLNNKNNRNNHNNKDNKQNKKQSNKRYKDCNQVYEILILTEHTYKQNRRILWTCCTNRKENKERNNRSTKPNTNTTTKIQQNTWRMQRQQTRYSNTISKGGIQDEHTTTKQC